MSAMKASDIYRGYAADCLRMSQERKSVKEKAVLVQMATMWQSLAEIAEKSEGENGDTDETT
jgi:hypothetical protein